MYCFVVIASLAIGCINVLSTKVISMYFTLRVYYTLAKCSGHSVDSL